METSAAMDVEEQPSPNASDVKRFGLKNSIQTNFGDDYVFQIVPKYARYFNSPFKLWIYAQTRCEIVKFHFLVPKCILGSNCFCELKRWLECNGGVTVNERSETVFTCGGSVLWRMQGSLWNHQSDFVFGSFKSPCFVFLFFWWHH